MLLKHDVIKGLVFTFSSSVVWNICNVRSFKGGTKRFSFFALFNLRTAPRLHFSLKLPHFGLKMIVYLSSFKWWKNKFWKFSQFRGIPQNVGHLFLESSLAKNLISPSFFKIFQFFLRERKQNFANTNGGGFFDFDPKNFLRIFEKKNRKFFFKNS